MSEKPMPRIHLVPTRRAASTQDAAQVTETTQPRTLTENHPYTDAATDTLNEEAAILFRPRLTWA
jgi:hypothetical protein